MSLWSRLFSFEPPSDETPDLPAPPPEGQVRLHFFSGRFEFEEELLEYCYGDESDDTPTPMTRDLPGAYIDTSYVISGFGTEIESTLGDFFSQEQIFAIVNEINPDNAVVLVSEYAFGGFPFSLNDTEKLTYRGAFLVMVNS